MKKKEERYFYLNKKIAQNYEIYDRLEAGIMLAKTDYPKFAKGKFDASKSFVWFTTGKNSQVYWKNLVFNGISEKRKLLLNRKEINEWYQQTKKRNAIVIVGKVYKLPRFVKVEILLVKSKNKGQKRKFERQKNVIT